MVHNFVTRYPIFIMGFEMKHNMNRTTSDAQYVKIENGNIPEGLISPDPVTFTTHFFITAAGVSLHLVLFLAVEFVHFGKSKVAYVLRIHSRCSSTIERSICCWF